MTARPRLPHCERFFASDENNKKAPPAKEVLVRVAAAWRPSLR